MSYPMPPPPPAPPAPPAAPVQKRRAGTTAGLRTVARAMGWLAVTALVAFSGMIILTWDHQTDARSASLRVASIEAPATKALSLNAGPASPQDALEGAADSPESPQNTPVPAADESAAHAAGPRLPALPSPVLELPAMREWPRSIALKGTPEVRVVSEDPQKDEFIYHTEHFEFCCDAPVGPDAVRHFARVFEATWMLNCQLPLDLRPAPETMRKWFRACILSTDESYAATGAPAGSSGYYSRADKTIYVPISSLGMKLVGQKRVMLDQSVESNDTLIHEITHQMMGRWLPRLPIWFAEGAAEYNGITDFVHGRFFLSGMESRLKNHLRASGGQSAGSAIRFTMLRLPELLAMDHRTWASGLSGVAGKENYASALLLTYFLYHLDRDRNAAGIIAWLRDIEKGRPHEQAFKEHILAGRNLLQFEAQFIHAWRQTGIELQFVRRGGAEFQL